MATASRLTNTGTLLVNNLFDEVTNAGDTSFATRTNSTGTVYTTNSTSGFDEVSYNPNGGTGQIGYNGTDTTTNKLKYTQDFSNALWVKQQLSTSIDVTVDATTAPDGSLTADKLAQSSTGGTYYSVYQNFTPTASTNYTYSMFVKNAGGTGSINLTIYDTVNAQYAQFNISTGVAGATTINGATFTLNSRSITSYGDGWYRCAFSFSSSLSGNFQFKVDFGVSGVGTGVYLWGAQLEQALTPTAYVGMLGTGVNINNFARRVVSTGVEYVSGEFDEVTWNPPIITSGLVLNLDAAVPGSYNGTGTTWTDLSGNSNNGTLINNPTFSNSNYGQFQFNYTLSQWVTFANASSLQFLNLSPFTLEAWIYPTVDAGATNYTGIFNRESSAMGTRDGYNFLIVQSTSPTTNQFLYAERFVGGAVSATVGEQIPTASFLNTWNHVVITFDGSVMKLYRNGVLKQTSAPTTANLTNNVQTLEVARRSGNYFRGNMPVARIYNTGLSLTDIKQNYNATCYRYGLSPI